MSQVFTRRDHSVIKSESASTLDKSNRTLHFNALLTFHTYRSVTAERVDELPSALSGSEDDKECADTAADVYCHVCVKKNKTSKMKADMFCYNCNNVFCDDHAGVCNVHGKRANSTKLLLK